MDISWSRILSGFMMILAIFFLMQARPIIFLHDVFVTMPMVGKYLRAANSEVLLTDEYIFSNRIEPSILTDDYLQIVKGNVNEFFNINDLTFVYLKAEQDKAQYLTSNKNVGILVYSMEDGEKILKNVIFNNAFYKNIRQSFAAKDSTGQDVVINLFPKNVEDAYEDIVKSVFTSNGSSQAQIDEIVKKYSTYNKNELKSLYSFCLLRVSVYHLFNKALQKAEIAIIAAQPTLNRNYLAKLSKSRQLLTKRIKEMTDYPLNAYGDVFVSKGLNGSLFFYYAKKNFVNIFLSLMSLFFAYHLFQKDFWSILKKELSLRGITLDAKALSRLMLTNWRLVFLPARADKLKNAAREIAEKYFLDRQQKEINAEAESAWEKIKKTIIDPGKLGEMKAYYRIAKGDKKNKSSLTQRQNALMFLLQTALTKKCVRQEPAQSPVNVIGKKNKKCALKSELLEIITIMLPDYDFSEFTTKELLNLIQAINYLRGIGDEYVDAFLELELKKVLKESRLWNAIKSGDRRVVKNELGFVINNQIASIDYNDLIETSFRLPSNLKVTIIGGGRVTSFRQELCHAVLGLGAMECEFIDASKPRAIDSLSNANNCLHISTYSLQHKQVYALRAKKLRMITVRGGNVKRFTQDIAREFKNC